MSFSKESSRLFGFVAGIKFPKMIQKVINENYVKYFNIDMSEFKSPCEYEFKCSFYKNFANSKA